MLTQQHQHQVQQQQQSPQEPQRLQLHQQHTQVQQQRQQRQLSDVGGRAASASTAPINMDPSTCPLCHAKFGGKQTTRQHLLNVHTAHFMLDASPAVCAAFDIQNCGTCLRVVHTDSSHTRNCPGAQASGFPEFIKEMNVVFTTNKLAEVPLTTAYTKSIGFPATKPRLVYSLPQNSAIRAGVALAFRLVLSRLEQADGTDESELLALHQVWAHLPRWLLTKPARGSSAADVIRGRLRSFFKGDLRSLHEPLQAPTSAPVTARTPQALLEYLVRHGHLRKAASRMRPTTALQEGATIPYNTLFPERDDPVISRSQGGNPRLPTVEEVDQTIAAADRTSAAGLSGLSFAHLKDLRSFDAAALVSTALRIITAETAPLAAKTFLRSHHVIPLPKPGSTEARPIAIPDSLMRIWSATTARAARTQLNAALLPFQLGTGASCAPEVATFTIRTLLDSDKNNMVLKTDFTNAYGLLSRQSVLAGLRLLKAPEPVLDYFGFVYGTPVPLVQGGKMAAHASTGLIQGDPLSPLCFSVGVHPMLLSIKEKSLGVVLTSFLDDMYAVGDVPCLERAFTTLVRESTAIGLKLRPEKCMLYACPRPQVAADSPLASLERPDGIMVLGSPIGGVTFTKNFLEKEFAAIEADVEHLQLFPRLQSRMHVLHHCISARLDHLARTVPPVMFPTGNRIDGTITGAIRQFTGDSALAHEDVCDITFLPARFGGLGFRSYATTLHERFLAGFCSARSHATHPIPSPPQGGLLHDCLQNALRHVKEVQSRISADNEATPLPTTLDDLLSSNATQQRHWVDLVSRWRYQSLKSLLTRDNLPFLAYVKASTLPGASDWLTTMASSKSLSVADEEFRTLLKLRLGVPLARDVADMCCSCCAACTDVARHGQSQAQFHSHSKMTAHHLHSCHHQGVFTQRHTALMDSIVQLATAAALRPVPNYVLPGTGAARIVADMAVQLGDTFNIMDLGVTSSRGSRAIHPREDDYAMQVYADAKRHHYQPAQRSLLPGQKIVYAIFEAQGGRSAAAQSLLQQIAEKMGPAPPPFPNFTTPDWSSLALRQTSVLCAKLTAKAINDKIALARSRRTSTRQMAQHPLPVHGLIATAPINLDSTTVEAPSLVA